MTTSAAGIRATLTIVAAGFLLAACPNRRVTSDPLDAAADRYLMLAAALGQRDPGSLESEGTLHASPIPVTRQPLPAIATEASALAASLRREPGGSDDEAPAFRRHHLAAQLDAIAARAELLNGRTLSAGEEWRRLYGVEAPAAGPADARDTQTLADLEALVPGRGTLTERVDDFDRSFLIPDARLPLVFERAMEECRARTIAQIALPADEAITIGYVRHEPWSGFSHYLGQGRSRVDVNVSLPLTIDRALELACHEGYPGHHVHNTLRDARLVQARGWREFSVMPVFSPESFASEAAASLATRMVFSDPDRLAFERDVLFPLAGRDAGDADRYLRVARLRERLEDDIAVIVARYLFGDLDVVEAGWALRDQALMKHPLATLQFVNQYRGYSLAYTLGKAQLDGRLGHTVAPRTRWSNLLRLIDGG